MPRFFPPHLMALVVLLVLVCWVMLVHRFRRSATMQKFVAETLGDNTPENALLAYEVARARLTDHLHDANLDRQMRQQIEHALGYPENVEAIESHTDAGAY